jgi:septin 3/9/12
MRQGILPFAVVGSEKTIVVNGKQVRGRQNRWGVINGKFFALNLLHMY